MSDTREKILDAMYDLVAECGYDKASIGKICTIVGISKPSVYYYFQSKEEIFTTMLDNMFPVIDFESKYSKIENIDEYNQALVELGDNIIDNYKDDQKRRNVLAELSIQANRIPALAKRQIESINRTMKVIQDILDRGVEIGAFPPAFNTRLCTQILYTLIEGMSQTVVQHEDIDEKAVWGATIKMIIDSTRPH